MPLFSLPVAGADPFGRVFETRAELSRDGSNPNVSQRPSLRRASREFGSSPLATIRSPPATAVLRRKGLEIAARSA